MLFRSCPVITQSFLFITCTDARTGSCYSHCFISRAEHNIQCAEVSPFISLWLLIILLLELSPSPMNAGRCCRFLLLILKLITLIRKGSSREAEPIHHTHTHTHLFVTGIWIYATSELVKSLCRHFFFPCSSKSTSTQAGRKYDEQAGTS